MVQVFVVVAAVLGIAALMLVTGRRRRVSSLPAPVPPSAPRAVAPPPPPREPVRQPRADRLWLEVPFAEKDQAKALHARWDPAARSWFLLPGVDPSPLLRWLADPLAVPGPQVHVRLVGLAVTCWKCQEPTCCVIGFVDAAKPIPPDHRPGQPNDLTMRVADRLLGEDARQRLGIGAIRSRFSRTVGHAYVSNGCRACDSLQGAFHLDEELREVLAEEDPSALTDLGTYAVPAAVWSHMTPW